MRLERRGGVEVEGCLRRGGDGWREKTVKVKRRVRVLCVSVLKKKGTSGFFNLSEHYSQIRIRK